MKKLFLVLFTLIIFQQVNSQIIVEPALVKWYTIEEAMELNKTQQRPIIIDFYTDWCGWCTHMMRTTFANQAIANMINANFYAVRFNAEGNDTVNYNGKTYYNRELAVNPKGTHEFAIEMMNNQRSYPTIVFLDKNGSKTPIPGYLDVKKIEPILYFFSEEIYNNALYGDYEKYFKLAFIPTEAEGFDFPNDTSGVVNWLTFEKAEELQKQNPKPMYIDVFATMYVSSNIMQRTTYRNPVIADYLNENFYPVQLNAASQETITFAGQVFNNGGNTAYSLHSLAAAFMQPGKVEIPLVVFLDANKQLMNRLTGLYLPEHLEPVLYYLAEEKYKTITWQEFLTTFVSKM